MAVSRRDAAGERERIAREIADVPSDQLRRDAVRAMRRVAARIAAEERDAEEERKEGDRE